MTFTIGVDVGGTKVLGGVVDEFGQVHKTARRDTPKAGGAALTAAIAEVANVRVEAPFMITWFARTSGVFSKVQLPP